VERAGPAAFAPTDVAVEGDRMFVAETEYGEHFTRARLFVPGAAPHELPWPGDVFSPIALAGGRAAFIGTPTKTSDHASLFVVNPTTGAVQSTINTDGTGTQFDLAPDGHVVAGGDEGLFTAGAGQPRTPLSGGEFLNFPTFAGTAVAGFERGDFGALTPAVVDPGAGQARPIGVATLENTAIDANATTVAWIAHGCVLSSSVAGPTPEEPPAGPCPRSEAEVESVDNVLARRTVHLTVFCFAAPAAGCRGQVTLRLRGKVAGRKRFHVASGERHNFTVRLSKRAARFVRKHVHRGDEVLVRMKARVTDGGPAETGSILLDHVRGA
jgi:hypothetical protein